MDKQLRTTSILLHVATTLLVLFGIFMVVNVFVLGKLPGRMELIIGKTSAEIAAYDASVFIFMLSAYRMFTILLLTYTVGLTLLTNAYRQGNAVAGRVVFVMQGLFLPISTVNALSVSSQTPWPIFALSGVFTLIAFLISRGVTATKSD